MKYTQMEQHQYNQYFRHLREIAKQKERCCNKSIDSNYIMKSNDYVFTDYARNDQDDRCGKLLKAVHKCNPKIQFLVKHVHSSCACNEFMYYIIASCLEIYVPICYLVKIVNEDRLRFESEYVVALELVHTHSISMQEMKLFYEYELCQFYFLSYLLCDQNSLEFLQDEAGRIFRKDNTDLFMLGESDIDYTGIYINIPNYVNIHDNLKKQTLRKLDLLYERLQKNFDMIKDDMNRFPEHKKSMIASIGNHIISKVSQIELHQMDEAINVLKLIYPDFIGEYYKEYISILIQFCKMFHL